MIIIIVIIITILTFLVIFAGKVLNKVKIHLLPCHPLQKTTGNSLNEGLDIQVFRFRAHNRVV